MAFASASCRALPWPLLTREAPPPGSRCSRRTRFLFTSSDREREKAVGWMGSDVFSRAFDRRLIGVNPGRVAAVEVAADRVSTDPPSLLLTRRRVVLC